jgi:hypothetical protein
MPDSIDELQVCNGAFAGPQNVTMPTKGTTTSFGSIATYSLSFRMRPGIRRSHEISGAGPPSIKPTEAAPPSKSRRRRVARSSPIWLEWGSSTVGQSLPAALKTKHKVPFDFAQGRLSTPQIIAFAMISSGRDDREGDVQTSQTWANEQTRLSSCHGD